ncbi:hypothetical protein VTL71DRAFT_4368 [Oculimacula yallundae]|uniref:CPAF-like PDZ domain-containing protein n=1 Tax=Oculimacula yallundae TaxID=86028 RepID=A0ABR4C3G4_9HELO
MIGLSLIVLTALARFPLANALPSTSVERATTQACGEIRDRVKAAFEADPGARPLVPAQLGYDCLQSVPLHKTEALAFVDSLLPYMEWQSSLADIKSPPADYAYPGVDVTKKVANIKHKLQHNKYTNEYSYMLDIYKTVVSAHDALFDVKPDILYAALTFIRPQNLALVSYSQDGLQLPKIYVRDDVKATSQSAVKFINGVRASQYIDKLIGSSSGFPDRDAGYNSYFYSTALEASQSTFGEFQGFGSGALIFDGPTTTLTFENGTSATYENQARVRNNFKNVTDGESFYQHFCSGFALPYPDSTAATTSPPRRYAYPTQMTDKAEDSIVGYYMDAPGYTDIAVLSILDWSPNSVTAFQAIAETFLARAKADNKKVILDLSSSSGGYYFLAYDLFKQFFPSLSVHDYARVRSHTAFTAMTRIASGPHFASYNARNATADEIAIAESVFNYAHFEVSINNTNFPTYESKYGPILHAGDNFTDIMRFNLSNPRISSLTDGFGLQITGLGSRANYTQSPFAASDVVILTDGVCVSPCPLFVTNMAQQGNVKTVVVGGRPSLTSMQSAGGTKGLESWEMGTVWDFAQVMFTFSPTAAQKNVLKTLGEISLNRLLSSLISFRDIITPGQVGTGEGKGVGSNFVREEADCRLFYTRDMVADQRELWKKVADVTWRGKKCVVGK